MQILFLLLLGARRKKGQYGAIFDRGMIVSIQKFALIDIYLDVG